MSSHSPRRGASNKKPRGGSYHYRPKTKNGSGGNGQSGNKNGNSSKYRDKSHGMDGGPSDDGGANDSDERHHPSSYAKSRTRYDRYDRFGSSSPRQSPTFGGQRPGNRRGSGGNGDRQMPRDNRRGTNRSKFPGRGSYDDDDDEETFGRRQGRNQHKRNNDRSSYGRDYGRDRDTRRVEDRRDIGGSEDFHVSNRDRRYGGYNNDGNERGGHYRPQRSHNPHRAAPPLDNLINIFRQYPADEDDEAMEEERIAPPPGLAEDRHHVYPIEYLMSLRKKPQHQLYQGPVLPDLVNRNLNPTPPPTEGEGVGVFGRHKEPTVPTRRQEAPAERSWRKSPNMIPSRQRDEPPTKELAGTGAAGASTTTSGDDATRPWKPPLHHGSKTFEEAEAARERQTSEEDIDVSGSQQQAQPSQTPQTANESASSMSQSQSRRSDKESNKPEWDSTSAPQDLWGSNFRFKQLDRDRDLKSLAATGRLLDANDVVIGDSEEDDGEADDEDGGNDERDVVFDDKRDGRRDGGARDKTRQNLGPAQLRPVPVSAMDSAALETQIGRGQLDEDEVSDEEILRKQIEEMNTMNFEDDDDDDGTYANVAEDYGAMMGFGKDDPDLSTIENNPWQKGDHSGVGVGEMMPQSSQSASMKAPEPLDLDLDEIFREHRDKYGTEKETSSGNTVTVKTDGVSPRAAQQQQQSSESRPQSHGPKVPSITVPQQVRAEMSSSSSPLKAANMDNGRRTADGEQTPGEVSVSTATGASGSMQQHPVPTEEQFQLYENKARTYYLQSVMFHQKYKKYQKLYTHAHEVMVADPSQRDPLMDKYIEKYQQHRQRFQLVYEKYRRYQQYLDHFGRKLQVQTYPRGYEYPAGPTGGGGDPRQQYPYQYGRQPNGDPRGYEYDDPRHGGGGYGHGHGHGPDPRAYANHGPPGSDPSMGGYGPYQQPYYPDRAPPRGYPEDYNHHDSRSARYGSQHAPRPGHGSSDYYHHAHPPGAGSGHPPPGWTQQPQAQQQRAHMQPVPHVKGSSALKIEKPPGRRSPQPPNMDDDTKTTPPASGAPKGEASGDAASPAANGSPADKDKKNNADDATKSGEFNEPREYRAHGYNYGGYRAGHGDGIDLGDLGYTSAPPSGRSGPSDRDRRDPSGYSGRGHDGVDRSDLERQQATQYADDYMKYYSRSSGGGMTRGEYEEYQEQKRRHYLAHYRRYGHYPGGGPAAQHGGGYGIPSGSGGRGPSARMDVVSPPMRQPSPGNPNDPYYNAYGPQYNAEDAYYQRASPAMMHGDYPQYYSRGHSKPEDY